MSGYQTSVTESPSFQNEIMNVIDKTLFSNNVTLNTNEYVGAPWLHADGASLVPLNPVNFTETHRNSESFQEIRRNSEHFQEFARTSENFQELPRTSENFQELRRNSESFQGIRPTSNEGVNYNNDVNFSMSYAPQENGAPTMTSYAVVPTMSTNTYIPQSKDDLNFLPNVSNVFSRFNNNYYLEPLRGPVQPNGSDVMGFTGLVASPASPLGMDGISTHEVQLSRVGIGAV